VTLAVALALHPAPVIELGWTWDPLSSAIIGATLGCYGLGLLKLWRAAGMGSGIKPLQAACFGLGELSLALALLSPLDRLSDGLFAAHMSQHELLMIVAAPLMVVGRPLTAYLWALPTNARIAAGHALNALPARWAWQFLSAPLFVLVLHGAVRWLWHLPALFEGAMRNEALHAVQHATFFGTAALFWWALLHGRYGKAGYGLAVLFVFATALHTSVLGALIAVAPRLLYPIYRERAAELGWQPLEDQELAGLLMWVPSGVLFLLCALALLAAWLGEAERRAARAERQPRVPKLLSQ
jgi:putative membrane protein